MHVWQRVHDPLDEARDQRRDLLELPPLLHGQAEARGHRRPRRALPAPRRQARPAGAPVVTPTAAIRVATPAETRLPDGALMAQRDAPVGGQAVLEGVMMRGVRHWAIAVRKPLESDRDAEGAVDPDK